MPNDLKHWGVLGMKWGIHKSTPSEDHTKARELRKKKVSELSNKEIQAITTRLSLEKQLSSLDAKKVNKGQQRAIELLVKFGPMIISAVMAKYAKDKYDAWQSNPVNTLPLIEGVLK